MVVQKHEQGFFVHRGALAEAQRPPHEPCQPLPNRVVHALDGVRPATALLTWPVLPSRHRCKVSTVQVGVHQLPAPRFGNAAEQHAAGIGTAISYRVSHDLSCREGHAKPCPDLVLLAHDKAPHLVGFQTVAFLRRKKRGFKRRKCQCFFPPAT